MKLPADTYQQFDADAARAVPAETFGGWRRIEVDIAPAHTALVVMHAWDCGRPGEFPGWRRAVEYHPRSERILRDVFPPLLAAVRRSPIAVFHVVGGGPDYYSHLPGYQRAARLAGATPAAPPQVAPDAAYEALQRQRAALAFPGEHNRADIAAGFGRLDFAPAARPRDDEGVAANGRQLAALCRAHAVNHLIYVGFAINWCLLMSPGGMIDMARAGCLCSTIAEAVTAVENRETAATEQEKRQALWRVAVEFGFVFHFADFVGALETLSP